MARVYRPRPVLPEPKVRLLLSESFRFSDFQKPFDLSGKEKPPLGYKGPVKVSMTIYLDGKQDNYKPVHSIVLDELMCMVETALLDHSWITNPKQIVSWDVSKNWCSTSLDPVQKPEILLGITWGQPALWKPE